VVAAGQLVRRDGQRAAPVATAAVLGASAVVAVHLVGVRSFSHEAWPAASPEADLPLWAAALSGACLVLGVLAAWVSRTARPGVALGLAAATVGAALPAWASWTGVPPTLRSAVLAAPALTAAGLAQTVPRWSAGRSWLGRLAWILGASAVLLHGLAYDPLADLMCTRVCRSVAGPWWTGPAAETVVAGEGAVVLAALAVGLVGVVVARSVPAMVRNAAGTSLTIVAAAVLAELGWRDSEVWARTTSLWIPWALGPAAGAVCILAVRSARTRRALDSLLRDLESGQADGVQFAVPGEDRWVDGAGRDVARDASTVVVLSDDHGPTVRLTHPRADPAAADLSPSRTLALSNARLTALAAARLADVRASQRRTVQRADSERQRIERDLHDGAQQALVSAAFHLSAVAHRTGTRPGVDEAQGHLATALAGLRHLAHGPVPEVLLYDGIRAALEDLAAEAPSQVTAEVHGEVEPAADVAVAAYLCVAALVGHAAPGPCVVDVDITEAGTRVVVHSSTDLANPFDQNLLDRVGALGGTSIRTEQGRESSTEVWFPCAS
jgi:signal transduction histidine kinase